MTAPRIVVGIDFGTTFSAIAWGNPSAPTHVTPLGNWPSCGARINHSVPTEISYQSDDSTDFLWGYEIPTSSRRLRWFKLYLEAQNAQTEGVEGWRGPKLPKDMTPTSVASDFLSALYQHVISTLWDQHSSAVMSATTIDFVLTVPAVWSDGAKMRTREAAELAGFTTNHRLQLLSEPEAAAIYAFKLQDTFSIDVNDRVVVCDCGGGTVDLISYKIEKTIPNLVVSECTIGTGDLCGATFIDRRFEQFVKKRMGRHYEKLKVETQQRVLRDFETVKCAFDDRPEKPTYFISIPTLDTIEEVGVVNGELELTREEMRSLFDPIVDSVISLVEEQVKACAQDGHRANAILLVGGFGESKYLFKKLKEWALPRRIECIQPRDAATAVVKGAVIRGMESPLGSESTSVQRKSRRHYGTLCNTTFIPGKHLEEDSYIDRVTGRKMAGRQVSWFIRRGDPLSDHQHITKLFSRQFRKYSGPWADDLVTCDLEVAPTRLQRGVTVLCSISTDLSDVKKSQWKRKWRKAKPYYVADYGLNVLISSGEITFSLTFNDNQYGNVSVNFHNLEPENAPPIELAAE